MEDKEMKKILATVASIAMVAACSTAAFAGGDIVSLRQLHPVLLQATQTQVLYLQ